MAEWIFFINPYRERFMETMTQTEQDAFARHLQWLAELDDEGRLILDGPTLGETNTGVGVFEAVDEAEAKDIAGEPGNERRIHAGGLASLCPRVRSRSRPSLALKW